MELIAPLSLIVTVIIGIWGIAQVRVTSKLQIEVSKLKTQLDQSLVLLHRAREAAIQSQSAQVFLMEYIRRTKESNNQPDWHIYAEKRSELAASLAELRGLAFAIGDKDLLEIVNNTVKMPEEFALGDGTGRVITHYDSFEMDLRGQAQKLHTRIAELIEMKVTQE